MIRTHKYLIFLFPLIFFPACSIKQVSVLSNTLVDQSILPKGFPNNSSFVIIAAKDNNTLLSKEIGLKIQKILINQGFTVTEYQYAADYQLIFDYSVEQKKAIKNVPFYIPGPTTTTYGNVYGNDKHLNYEETTHTTGSFIYLPKEYTYYIKGIAIKVYEQGIFMKKDTEVWNGTGVCNSENLDPRSEIDYLLAAVFENFGHKTPNFIETKFRLNDDDTVKQSSQPQNIK